MTHPPDLVSRLRKAHTAVAHAAAEKALAGKPAIDDLARLKDYEKLIEVLDPPRSDNLIPAVAVGVACLFLAGLAWAVRIPSTKVHATVVTDAVTFRLANSWQWSGNWHLGGTIFRLDEMTEITLPPELLAQSELRGRAWLDVEKGQIALSSMELGAHGALTILRDAPSAINILSLNGSVRGEAQISGESAVSAGDAPSRPAELQALRFDVPGTLSFFDAGRPSIPARIRLNAGEKITWRNISIEGLSFAREVGGGIEAPQFTSGIESGTATLSDTGDKIALKEKDQLFLGGVSGIIQELEIGPDALRITFEGQAKKLSVGVTGFEEDLAPTWLNYMYRQERLGFFWSAAAFLWGLLWSARQLLFK